MGFTPFRSSFEYVFAAGFVLPSLCFESCSALLFAAISPSDCAESGAAHSTASANDIRFVFMGPFVLVLGEPDQYRTAGRPRAREALYGPWAGEGGKRANRAGTPQGGAPAGHGGVPATACGLAQ